MTLPNKRIINWLGFFACAGMMAFALYAQYELLMDPCPLCTFQRIAVVLMGLIFLAAAIHSPQRTGSRIYAVLLAVTALYGAAVAGWHIHLQNLPPDQVPSCGPGLGYMMDTLPLGDMLKAVFTGSGECASVSWRFLSLSMPSWVLIGVLVLGGVGVANNGRKQRS